MGVDQVVKAYRGFKEAAFIVAVNPGVFGYNIHRYNISGN